MTEEDRIMGKLVRAPKCHCCGHSTGEVVYEKNGKLRYSFGGAMVEQDPDSELGLNIWDCVTESDVLDPTPTTWWIENYQKHLIHQGLDVTTDQILERLNKPFISLKEVCNV